MEGYDGVIGKYIYTNECTHWEGNLFEKQEGLHWRPKGGVRHDSFGVGTGSNVGCTSAFPEIPSGGPKLSLAFVFLADIIHYKYHI